MDRVITQTIYIQQVFVELDRDSWCPECLLASVVKATYGIAFQPNVVIPSMVGTVKFCGDCGREIE